MWQDIIVYSVVALGAGFTLWSFYAKFTRQDSCCGGGCTCKKPCGSGGSGGRPGKGGHDSPGCSAIG